MKRSSRYRLPLAILACVALKPSSVAAELLHSPTWGFSIDLPEGYALVDGDGRQNFSFASEAGSKVDLIVYQGGRFASPDEVSGYAAERLGSDSEFSDFTYRGRRAIIMSLDFDSAEGPAEGWGLCLELGVGRGGNGKTDAAPPFLLALAYGPTGEEGLDGFHRSALDSIAPTAADRRAPGPLSTFAYPATKRKNVRIAHLDAEATVDENDAEAARSLVDREFAVLTRYASSPLWKEAWTRFYRFIYRDSYERLADISLTVERVLSPTSGASGDGEPRRFAERALGWVQSFAYERNLMGSDFVDLVTAAVEGAGDCDSRSLLLATVLMHARIDAAIMVSRDYSHAMGLVDVGGSGARFEKGGTKWVVAETTAEVPLGLIGKDKADPAKWLAIELE